MVGIDTFTQSFSRLRKVPLSILTNHAAIAGSGYPVACELLRQGFSVKKIFSPEHGVFSQGEDGKAQLGGHDKFTNLPVISLYGNNFQPQEQDLQDVEIVLVDLPNVGCRFYTYWWTISYMMEACSAAGKKMILLDRPNLSNRKTRAIEGPLLDEEHCSSFLGRWRMPLTFGYSYGQLVKWFLHDRNILLDHEVIPFHKANHQVFIPPSPAISDLQAVGLYPFTGLFEGLNINLGRGTSFPFRVIGAPWINPIHLHDAFKAQQFPGIKMFPYSYQPVWSRYAGETCYGLYFYMEDMDAFRPVETGLWLMSHLSNHYNTHLKPGTYPTVANPSGEKHLDLLLGMPDSYDTFCSGVQLSPGTNSVLDVKDWATQVDEFLFQS